MIGSDKAVNQFLEKIKGNLDEERSSKQDAAPSHVVINRAVRCTIIVGQPPEAASRITPKRGARKS